MKQAETTRFTICTDIFQRKYMDIKGDGEVVIEIDFSKDGKEVTVEMRHHNEDTKLQTLYPGDTYTLHHHAEMVATKDIQKDHAFPITFKMDGQEYKLNRTKQNKLILTK